MPKLVELPDGRVIEFPDGMTDKQIDVNLRLSLARDQGVSQAEAGAIQRSEEAQANPPMSPWAESAMAGMSGEGGAFADPNATGKDIMGRAAGMAATAGAVGTGTGLLTAPIATGKGILGSVVGGTALSEGGKYLGERLPFGLGGETAGSVLGTVGGLVGGVGGGMIGPKIPIKELIMSMTGGGKAGLLSRIIGGGELAAAKGAATQAAKTVAPEVARKAELQAKLLEGKLADQAAKRVRDAELHQIKIDKLKAQRAPKTIPKPVPEPKTEGATALKPDPDMVSDEAVSLVAEPLPFTPRAARPPKPKFVDDSAVSVAPSAPFDQRAIPGDAAQIAQQIQQKTGSGMRGGKALVQEELDKLPAGTRAQVEEILARGQGHPATAASGATRSVGTAAARESKPLSDPLMEFARQAARKGETSPVSGSKIWIETDSAGNPVRVLKDGYARPEAGNSKTWVANLWGSETASNVF